MLRTHNHLMLVLAFLENKLAYIAFFLIFPFPPRAFLCVFSWSFIYLGSMVPYPFSIYQNIFSFVECVPFCNFYHICGTMGQFMAWVWYLLFMFIRMLFTCLASFTILKSQENSFESKNYYKKPSDCPIVHGELY